MKKETIIILALLIGIGGYRYWQEQQKKKISVPKELELANATFKILQAIDEQKLDSAESIRRTEKVFKVSTQDANKLWELYSMNKNAELQEFDKILRENDIIA